MKRDRQTDGRTYIRTEILTVVYTMYKFNYIKKQKVEFLFRIIHKMLLIDGHTDGPTDIHTDGQIDGHTFIRTDILTRA